jgi:hypothetical protein
LSRYSVHLLQVLRLAVYLRKRGDETHLWITDYIAV